MLATTNGLRITGLSSSGLRATGVPRSPLARLNLGELRVVKPILAGSVLTLSTDLGDLMARGLTLLASTYLALRIGAGLVSS